MLVEPACGTALAAIYNHKKLKLDRTFGVGKYETTGNPVVVIVCGGSMASIPLFQEWKEQLGIHRDSHREY